MLTRTKGGTLRVSLAQLDEGFAQPNKGSYLGGWHSQLYVGGSFIRFYGQTKSKFLLTNLSLTFWDLIIDWKFGLRLTVSILVILN